MLRDWRIATNDADSIMKWAAFGTALTIGLAKGGDLVSGLGSLFHWVGSKLDKPVLDASGKPVLKPDGKPLMDESKLHWVGNVLQRGGISTTLGLALAVITASFAGDAAKTFLKNNQPAPLDGAQVNRPSGPGR